MNSTIVDVIALVADNPVLQEAGAKVVAGFLKQKLPSVVDKTIGDFCVRVGTELGGSAPAPA